MLTVVGATTDPAGGDLDAVVRAVFTEVADTLSSRTTMLLAASAACVAAADRFARQWADTSRVLRPSDSIGMETSELLRRVGWPGPVYLVVTPDADTRQARRIARVLAAGRETVYGEISAEPGAGFRVTAMVVRP
ncbi:hypothetical protein [Actinokineospora sp.]|uniref:hypothetical protein n=1 Tax=Actinokineospora sp. TaxID=1872133 RepID=UPI0040382BD8